MLYDAGLDQSFWPFAFHHYLRIYNCLPHGSRSVTPYEGITHKKPDYLLFHVFGCRVYGRQANGGTQNLRSFTHCGNFLGYTSTMSHAIRWALMTK